MIYFRCRRISSSLVGKKLKIATGKCYPCSVKFHKEVAIDSTDLAYSVRAQWTKQLSKDQNVEILNRIPYNEIHYTRNVNWLIQLCYMGIMKYVTVIHKKSLVFYKFLNRQYAFYFTNLVKKKYNALSTFGIYLQCTFTQTMFDYSYAQCSVQKT